MYKRLLLCIQTAEANPERDKESPKIHSNNPCDASDAAYVSVKSQAPFLKNEKQSSSPFITKSALLRQ